eukprot:TRINITY_DN14849_c0_g1_i1.p1 TRINITY_DN14849_c0_g1~~TRINITY_DN14849_c0_g1_i1.p1  ORF type:complete len:506 (-),score=49.97 TRINITY_DN14849_c0_g1_i1:200-1627(-)
MPECCLRLHKQPLCSTATLRLVALTLFVKSLAWVDETENEEHEVEKDTAVGGSVMLATMHGELHVPNDVTSGELAWPEISHTLDGEATSYGASGRRAGNQSGTLTKKGVSQSASRRSAREENDQIAGELARRGEFTRNGQDDVYKHALEAGLLDSEAHGQNDTSWSISDDVKWWSMTVSTLGRHWGRYRSVILMMFVVIVLCALFVQVLRSLQAFRTSTGGNVYVRPDGPGTNRLRSSEGASSQDNAIGVLKACLETIPAEKGVPPFPMHRCLCPQLVVPWGCECAIIMQPLVIRGLEKEIVELLVEDTKGVPLLKVVYGTGFDANSIDEKAVSTKVGLVDSAASRSLRLFAARSGSFLAAARVSGGNDNLLTLSDSSGQTYGELKGAEGGKFVLSMTWHQRLHIRASVDGSNQIVATSQDSRLLSFVEPAVSDDPHGARLVVIGPLFDAGLMVLCLAGMDLLRHEVRKCPVFPG